MTTIENSLFVRCSNLSIINIHDDVTTIELGAFRDCISLRNVIIPPKVASIMYYAFERCSNLSSVEIRGDVTLLQNSAFADCLNLNSFFYYGKTNPSNDSRVFSGSPIDVIYVTPKYSYNSFCGLPAFSMSEIFSVSYDFTKSDLLSKSSEFTKSKFI